MKKFLSIIAAGTLALLALSCAKEEKAVFDVSQATPPVLREVIVEDNVSVLYTPAVFNMEFNQSMKTYHTLALVSVGGKDADVTLTTKDEGNTLTLTGKNLTNALKARGYNIGDQVDLTIVVRGSIQDPSRGITNGYIDSKEKYSFKWTLVDASGGGGPKIPQIDLSQYEYLAVMEGAETWGIIGPAVSDWSTDVDLQKISSDPEVWYAAGVPFNADSFKFRGNDTWGDYDLGGGEFALDAPIVMSKGGGDMTSSAGSYDVYLFPTYGVAYLTNGSGGGSDLPDVDLDAYEYLSVMEGAETWGVIGPAVSDWSTDVDLEKISDDPEIWCAKGMPFQEDKFKFRGNDTWGDYDLGGGVFAVEEPIVMSKGGGDMTAVAGNYDVYLYPTYGVAYLKPAGGDTPPPPEKPKAWSLIGTLEDSGWGTDYDLENVTGNTWVIKNVFVREKDEFKIRADHAWNKSFGGPEENAESTYEEGNVYGVYQPVIGETFTAGGTNIRIGVEGYYNITLNYGNDESTILIEEYKEFPDHVYMIGQDFGGWNWDSDGVVELVPVVHQPSWGAEAEAQFWTVKYFKAGSDHGFKFCSQKAWNGDFWGLDENDGFVEAGGNCTVETDGFYLVHIDFKRSMVHVEPARVYGIGNCFGGWDEGMESALFKADGQKLKATVAAAGELRMYVASSIATSDWWTREFIFFEDGKIDYRGDDEGQGDQARLNVLADQVVVLDFNAGTGAIEGEGVEPEPAKAAFMIGEQFGGWSWDSDGVVELVPVWGTDNYFWCTRWFDATKGFKFCGVREWNGDYTGDGTVGYTVSDGNCWVAESGLYTVLVDALNKSVEITPAEIYGLGDAVFTGGWDFDSAQKFTVEGDKVVITTAGAGELRMASKVMPSAPIEGVTTGNGWIDWWKTEFIFFEDGVIDYRGAGPDQARRNVEAGQTITLDFNAGTATIGGGSAPAANITIDGNPADWEGNPNVVSLECPTDAEMTGMASAKILYSDKLYFLVKFSDAALADGKVRLHVYFDTDNFGCQAARWTDNNIDYMLEGKMTSGGAFVSYASTFYKFTGANPTDWSGCWEATDFAPVFESAGNDHWYELSMSYDGYPGGLPEQFMIGLDMVDSNWATCGFLPQTEHMLVIKKNGIAEQL